MIYSSSPVRQESAKKSLYLFRAPPVFRWVLLSFVLASNAQAVMCFDLFAQKAEIAITPEAREEIPLLASQEGAQRLAAAIIASLKKHPSAELFDGMQIVRFRHGDWGIGGFDAEFSIKGATGRFAEFRVLVRGEIRNSLNGFDLGIMEGNFDKIDKKSWSPLERDDFLFQFRALQDRSKSIQMLDRQRHEIRL